MTSSLAFRRIVFPQIWRTSLPSLVNEMTLLVKVSPAIAVIGVVDITRAAVRIGAETYEPLPPFLAATALYFVILLVLVRVQRSLESSTARKFGAHEQRIRHRLGPQGPAAVRARQHRGSGGDRNCPVAGRRSVDGYGAGVAVACARATRTVAGRRHALRAVSPARVHRVLRLAHGWHSTQQLDSGLGCAWSSIILRTSVRSCAAPGRTCRAATSMLLTPSAFTATTLYRRIILPPVVYAAVPVLGNQVIQIIKDTAFLMIIAVPELTHAASSIQATYYVPFAAFVAAVALYWILCRGVEMVVGVIERRAEARR